MPHPHLKLSCFLGGTPHNLKNAVPIPKYEQQRPQWSFDLVYDENHFSATSDSQGQLIWGEFGAQFYPSNFKERDHCWDLEIVGWGGIMLKRRTKLHLF
ncbi:hypothetical protein TNCV_2402481 [Trichonephila clavipes]|nr:hypothetical protein TNCV_2402481 [Trichonephila clavipes]